VPAGGLTVSIVAAAGANPTISVSAGALVVGPVSITFTQALPTSMLASSQTMISATVFNDPANAGVDWTVSCGSSSCGSFNPTHTVSAVDTAYTAPATIPNGNTVTITATATADPTKFISGTITITSPGQVALLNGQYTFLVTGQDDTGFYTAAGSLKADGAGDITGGEEDYINIYTIDTGPSPILGGSYQIGSDGRGSITLKLQNASIGQSGTQTMSISVVTSQHILITEFDTSATSSGSLNRQTTTSLSSGGYSFAFTGLDITPLATLNPPLPMSLGGVMTADGAGNLSGVSMDVIDNGQVSSKSGSGTYGTPADLFGRGTATLPVVFSSSSCPSSTASTLTFVYYVVNSTTAEFVETDACGLNGGSAYAQGTGPFSKASIMGNYAFALAGPTANATGSVAAGGLFTANGSGAITSGIVDVNNTGTVTNGTPTGTYTMSANGRGNLTLNSSTGGVSSFGIYVSKSQGVLLVELDSGLTGIGAALPQSGTITSSTFKGNYAINFDSAITTTCGSTITNGEEVVVGQVAADGVSALTAGHVDIDQQFPGYNGTCPLLPPTPDVGLTGAFSGSSNGRFTGTLSTSTTGTLQEIFYVVNSYTMLLLEVDAKGQATGLLQLQTF
jgi:hypothetical protein